MGTVLDAAPAQKDRDRTAGRDLPARWRFVVQRPAQVRPPRAPGLAGRTRRTIRTWSKFSHKLSGSNSNRRECCEHRNRHRPKLGIRRGRRTAGRGRRRQAADVHNQRLFRRTDAAQGIRVSGRRRPGHGQERRKRACPSRPRRAVDRRSGTGRHSRDGHPNPRNGYCRSRTRCRRREPRQKRLPVAGVDRRIAV